MKSGNGREMAVSRLFGGVMPVVCGALLAWPLAMVGGEEPPLPLDGPGVHQPRWEIGPEWFWYYYEEPGLMDLTGWMLGLDGRVTWVIPRRSVLERRNEAGDLEALSGRLDYMLVRLHGRYAAGKADYDGSLLDEARTPYTISNIDASSYEVRFLVGYAPHVRAGHYIAFLMGYGYRYKEDDASFDPAGYKRESTYRYIPLSVEHVRALRPDRSLAFAVEYDHFMSGEQISDLRPFGGPRLRNRQRSGYGLRAAAAWSGTGPRVDWTVEPFVRYWDIDDSDPLLIRVGPTTAVFYEPENTTVEAGLSVRLLF